MRLSVAYLMCTVAAAAATCSAVAAGLAPGARMVLDNFKTRGVQDDGRLHWRLKGRKAVVHGVLADLQEAELVFYLRDGETARITSPKCSFNQTTAVGQSEAPLSVESQTIRLSGIGYDLWAREQKLRIRRSVRMTILRTREVIEKVPLPRSEEQLNRDVSPRAVPADRE